jgi:hypothetical protein
MIRPYRLSPYPRRVPLLLQYIQMYRRACIFVYYFVYANSPYELQGMSGRSQPTQSTITDSKKTSQLQSFLSVLQRSQLSNRETRRQQRSLLQMVPIQALVSISSQLLCGLEHVPNLVTIQLFCRKIV